MRINKYQRILLILYILLFLLFTVFFVPYYGAQSSVYYDTIFADKADIVYGRMGLALLVVTFLTGLIYMILIDIQPEKTIIKLKVGDRLQKVVYSVILIAVTASLIGYGTYGVIEDQKAKVEAEKKRRADMEAKKRDELNRRIEAERRIRIRGDMRKYCTQSAILQSFREYLKFNYANYRIVGNPAILPIENCIYRVSYTAIDSRYEILGKNYYVMEVSYNPETYQYFFQELRGRL